MNRSATTRPPHHFESLGSRVGIRVLLPGTEAAYLAKSASGEGRWQVPTFEPAPLFTNDFSEDVLCLCAFFANIFRWAAFPAVTVYRH